MATLSIDIGIKNFAWVLEISGKISSLGIICLENDRFDIGAMDELFEELEKKHEDWRSLQTILIEIQFFQSFGGRRLQANLGAIKVQFATMAWFRLKFPHVIILQIHPKEKTGILRETFTEARKMNYSERKRISVETAVKYLERTSQSKVLEFLHKLPKKDDIADCILQLIVRKKLS